MTTIGCRTGAAPERADVIRPSPWLPEFPGRLHAAGRALYGRRALRLTTANPTVPRRAITDTHDRPTVGIGNEGRL
jgi:hypothetical protein